MDDPLSELEAWWSDKYYDDDDSDTGLVSFESSGESGVLRFSTVDYEEARAEWRLEIGGCAESVWRGERGDPCWFAHHALLFPHVDRRAWVSFAKPLNDPLRAYGAVAQAHRQAVGDWIRLERYFRESMLFSPFGILAQGAERVVAAYAEALGEIGEDVGLASQDRARPVEEPWPTVVTWGGSYFVARSFRLIRTR